MKKSLRVENEILKKQLMEVDTANVLNELAFTLHTLAYENPEGKEVVDFSDVVDILNLYITDCGGKHIKLD